MPKGTARRVLRVVLLGVVSVLALLGYLLFTAEPLPEKARFSLNLEALRAAAGLEEALPTWAAADRVAQAEFPLLFATAGGPFSKVWFGFYTWQFGYADGSWVVVDAVHSPRAQNEHYRGSPYDEVAWARQEAALAGAKAIVVTHEHHDHLGGVADSAHLAQLTSTLMLTPEQLTQPRFGGVDRPLQTPARLESGAEGSLHPVAPGVVAVSAAGHTAGSMLVYVRTTTKEFLLIGDVAWQELALVREKTRPRLPSLLMGEDATAIVHQLRAVIDFKAAHPEVEVVVAHDIASMERRFEAGIVKRHLQVQ